MKKILTYSSLGMLRAFKSSEWAGSVVPNARRDRTNSADRGEDTTLLFFSNSCKIKLFNFIHNDPRIITANTLLINDEITEKINYHHFSEINDKLILTLQNLLENWAMAVAIFFRSILYVLLACKVSMK